MSAPQILQSALDYAERGFHVFPLHTPDPQGRCSCHKDCGNVGKHPRTMNGLKDATTDEATIRQWFRQWPDANIGIATGAASGFFVLDVDPRSGGSESLKTLLAQHGKFAQSVWAKTGGGGWHLLFKHPGGKIKSSAHALSSGLDVKGDGGYIVAAPSLHASGQTYAWGSEYDAIPDAPDWLQLLVTSPADTHTPRDTSHTSEGEIGEGRRNQTLTSLAGSMRRRGMTEAAIYAALVVENEARCSPPLADADVRKIANSVSRYAPEDPAYVFSDRTRKDAETKPERKSQATILVELASEAEFFHTADNEAYASVEIGGHLETWPLKSRGFRDWLMRRFYEMESKSPNTQGFQDALGVLYGRARFDGETREVHTRIAAHAGAIYVDLADEAWRIVQITAEGWSIVASADAPVRFRRSCGTKPLPEPVSGGTLNDLRCFVNVKDDTDWTLLLAWLVASLRPNLPLPLLALYGAQGSAKSTMARALSSLVDPAKAALRSAPRDERDLMSAARHRWCLTFDNLSQVSNSLSDALCRLATSGGLSTRKLYSDDEEMLFEALRPVIINGIEDLATRGDLLSRAVVLYLPAIKLDVRRKEADLWREFEGARPAICGALFDAVSIALGRVESVKLDGLPRMADFAAWAVAAEPAFGVPAGTFIEAYAGNRATANITALDESPLSEAVMKLLDSQPKLFWSGKASELLDELKRHVSEQMLRDKAWPKAANALTNKLRRLGPSLRVVGIAFRESRAGHTRAKVLTLEKVEKRPSASSASSADEQYQHLHADDDADDLSGADDLFVSADDLFVSADDPKNERPSAPNLKQTQGVTAIADDADDLLRAFSGMAGDEEPLSDEETELAAHLEGYGATRAEADATARRMFQDVPF